MPKVIDHDQRRREIVEVAKRLIIDGGFEAATMRSIVTAAGFANGALKHYFASKDAIVEATFESVLAETGERMDTQDPDLGPSEGLRAFIEAGMPLDEHRIDSARVLIALWNHAMTNPGLAHRYRNLLVSWRHELVHRIAQVRIAQVEGEQETSSDGAAAVWADEIISVTVGAHVTSLMFPPGKLAANYQAYTDQLMARILA